MHHVKESLGAPPYATLDLHDEAKHARVRVRDHFGKASITLTASELEKFCLDGLQLARLMRKRGLKP